MAGAFQSSLNGTRVASLHRNPTKSHQTRVFCCIPNGSLPHPTMTRGRKIRERLIAANESTCLNNVWQHPSGLPITFRIKNNPRKMTARAFHGLNPTDLLQLPHLLRALQATRSHVPSPKFPHALSSLSEVSQALSFVGNAFLCFRAQLGLDLPRKAVPNPSLLGAPPGCPSS